MSSPRASKRATFVLGVGAQKSGTTWFHDYLKTFDAVNLGVAKEYHVFDLLHIPERRRFYWKALRDGAAAYARERFYAIRGKEPPFDRFAARRMKIAELLLFPHRYFDYFADLLAAPGAKLTADITPSYTGLGVEALARIRDGFRARGIDVIAVLLMRDPVERCWSAVRMGRRNRIKKNAREVSRRKMRLTEEEHLLRTYKTPYARQLTDYPATIARLEQVFGADRVVYEFYETLFTAETMARMCERLGLPYRLPDFDRSSNVSEKSGDIADSTRREIALHFADVYRGIADRCGAEQVRAVWENYRFVD